jgi:hypothetical protein
MRHGCAQLAGLCAHTTLDEHTLSCAVVTSCGTHFCCAVTYTTVRGCVVLPCCRRVYCIELCDARLPANFSIYATPSYCCRTIDGEGTTSLLLTSSDQDKKRSVAQTVRLGRNMEELGSCCACAQQVALLGDRQISRELLARQDTRQQISCSTAATSWRAKCCSSAGGCMSLLCR